jgi:hypothetical protein
MLLDQLASFVGLAGYASIQNTFVFSIDVSILAR